MIKSLIYWSIKNRGMVLLATLFLVVAGIYSIKQTPIDAIPDLSEVQVIVKTSYPGQAPQVVEDQVTYPLTSTLLSVPKAKTVRGFSFFGDSYVYVIFEEGTDLYWARARVQEYLGQVASKLPPTASSQLGPDATGVGWVFIYALQDRTGQHDLSQLRSIQDWFLKYELQTVSGVSEIATVGGMVKQYQIILDPEKLKAHNIPLSLIENAIQQSNQEVGASVIEMAEAEYMVRATGYVTSESDLLHIPLGINDQQTPLLLKDVATIQVGPQMRRGIAELNGQGETVGGIVVMRYGENAQQTIAAVKDKLKQLENSLPDGVEVITVYDRSELIDNAVENLWHKLAEELLVVGLICLLFLLHIRSSLVAIISLPVGILMAFIVMKYQGLNANIMSLGGIAIAIGAMIDGAIVMIENMHKHMESTEINDKNRWEAVAKSASEVGPALFFSLLIITVSFLPVFTLEAQEGKLFSPLAYTKTYAMAAAAALAVTLVPVLMGYFVRGKIRSEHNNPINRLLTTAYLPILKGLLHWPKTTVLMALLLLSTVFIPLNRMGSEFMPPLDEGDLMYMPTTYPGISIGKARELLQQTDKLIKTVPEVATVFGKIGRAKTATDPAPLTMIETFIHFKPKSEWRTGMTTEKLKQELSQLIQFPGVSNAWVMPIKTRIDMLATGIKTPVGIKVSGPELPVIEAIGQQIETLMSNFPGTTSVYAERVAGGRYITVDINRMKAAQFGLTVAQIQHVLATAVGGKNLAYSTEGTARYPIQMRYPQHYRDSPKSLKQLPVIAPNGLQLTLGDVASIQVESGPAGIKSENARPNGWTFIDIEGVDVGNYVADAQKWLNQELELPAGYALTWSGQFEYMERAKAKLTIVLPMTLLIIALLLFLNFKNMRDVVFIMGTLPLALVGSIWLLYWLDYDFSVAVGVGMIALAGVAVETAVIMLVYLNQALEHSISKSTLTVKSLYQSVIYGAGMRLRPVLMTAAATTVGLLPVMWGDGTGSEVMRRLAAPMVGGMVSSVLLTLLLLPVIFYLWHSRSIGTKIADFDQE